MPRMTRMKGKPEVNIPKALRGTGGGTKSLSRSSGKAKPKAKAPAPKATAGTKSGSKRLGGGTLKAEHKKKKHR